MLEEDGKDFNQRWGYLSRAGLNDKSQFTRQIEKYAGDSSSPCDVLATITCWAMLICCCGRMAAACAAVRGVPGVQTERSGIVASSMMLLTVAQ